MLNLKTLLTNLKVAISTNLKTNLLKVLFELLIISLLLFSIASIFSTLLFGDYFNTGYFDWVMHAYRAKLFQNFGVTSWVNLTGNGHDFWRAYQIVPHLLVSTYSTIFHKDILRSMFDVLFISLLGSALFTYIGLRLNKTKALIAFMITFLSFTVCQFAVAIMDFSSGMGFCFLPIYLFAFNKLYDTKWKFSVIPLLLGLAFYIHPITAFTVFFLWGIFVLSHKEKNWKGIVFDFLIFVLISSYYTIPMFFYSGDSYFDPRLNTIEFVRRLSTLAYYGYNFTSWFMIGFVSILLFFSLNKDIKSRPRTFLIILYFIIVWISIVSVYKYTLVPAIIVKFQISRWVPFITFITLYSCGIFLSDLWDKLKSKFILGIFLVIIGVFGFVEAFNAEGTTSILRYLAKTSTNYEEPVHAFFEKYPERYKEGIHIFITNATEAAYFNFGKIKVEGSYFHYSPNPIQMNVNKFLDVATSYPNGYSKTLDYFRARNVKYIFISERLNATKLLLAPPDSKNAFKYIDEFETDFYGKILVFEAPWETYEGIAFENNNLEKFPEEAFKGNYDFNKIETYLAYFRIFLSVGNFKEVSKVSYPSQESIYVENVPAHKRLLLFTSYDRNWVAETSEGAKLKVELAGPSYLSLVNDSDKPVNISLQHHFPASTVLSFYLVALGFLIWLIVLIVKIALKLLTIWHSRYNTDK